MMGATLYREHKVCKMDLGIDDGGLFGSETVIVASQRCEKNCYPHTYKWGIEFIGGVDKFVDQYLPRTAYFFDDGLSQSSRIPNGSAFQRHLKSLYESAGPLSVEDLHGMGFYGYSWSEENGSVLSDRTNLKTFSYWLGTRCAGKLDTPADVEKMIREACEISGSNPENIWMAGLWSLSSDQVAALENAENEAHFNSLFHMA